jgi:hypothetical protein
MDKEHAVGMDGVKVPPDHPKMRITITTNLLLETGVISTIQIRIIIVMETEHAVTPDGVKEHQDDRFA